MNVEKNWRIPLYPEDDFQSRYEQNVYLKLPLEHSPKVSKSLQIESLEYSTPYQLYKTVVRSYYQTHQHSMLLRNKFKSSY